MKLFFKKQKGFTLIELLVIMAIIGIIMPMGVSAFIGTRNARLVSNDVSDVRDTIKNARAKALSISLGATVNKWPVGYVVEITKTGFTSKILYSSNSSNQYSQWLGWSNISTTTDTISSQNFSGGVGATLSSCNRVVFSSVDGDMYVYNGTGLVTSNCYIKFSLGNKSRTLILNSSTKTFEIE